MPMVGHIAETGLVIGHEFREGNAAPAAGNLEFLQACERNMPKGKKITAMRADSAAYQAAIFNYGEETGKVFAIGADRDAAVKAAIAAIPESAWKPFQDGEIAETVHCMNRNNNAFRLIVVRHPRDLDLFEDKSPYRYHAIASNRVDEDAAATMEWYSKRGDTSENRIKDWDMSKGLLAALSQLRLPSLASAILGYCGLRLRRGQSASCQAPLNRYSRNRAFPPMSQALDEPRLLSRRGPLNHRSFQIPLRLQPIGRDLLHKLGHRPPIILGRFFQRCPDIMIEADAKRRPAGFRFLRRPLRFSLTQNVVSELHND